MPTFELISNYLCPYTQRAAIQLAEKGIAYERVYIDLANKPEWFLQVSPLGKVPLLRVGDAALFETRVGWLVRRRVAAPESVPCSAMASTMRRSSQFRTVAVEA